MRYFSNFIDSGDHFTYVCLSYFIVFLILFLMFFLSYTKTKKLEKEFTLLSKNETKK